MKHFTFLFATLLGLSCSLHTQAQIITTIAGGDSLGLGDGGPAIDCELNNPADVAVDGAGNVYIADGTNNRIRKINTSGIITTIAGTGVAGYNGDDMAATLAELSYPSSIALDGSGNIYVCDDHNYRIRMVSASGIISTIAGTGSSGYTGDNGPATLAKIGASIGIAVDGSGNIYISEGDLIFTNSYIRKISSAVGGIITTIAGIGTAGHTGDGGPATAAEISTPTGVAVDGSSNVYFGERGSGCIRKINATGIITTIAGTGTGGFGGDNGPATLAQLNQPSGITIDVWGNLYIADVYNYRVRKVNTSGIINTIAGTETGGFSGDGGPATLAELILPSGIAVDGTGGVYIADWGNNRIRYIKSTVAVNTLSSIAAGIKVYPNPGAGQFTTNVLSATDEQTQIIITNTLGERVKDVTASTNKPVEIWLDVPPGIYFLNATTAHGSWGEKIVIMAHAPIVAIPSLNKRIQ